MEDMPQPPMMSYQEEKKQWTAHKAANGLTYYFNSKTKKSQWEKPECLMTDDEKINESDWIEYNTAEGKVFYYNIKLKKSVWKMPAELRAIKEKQAEMRKLQAQNFNKIADDGGLGLEGLGIGNNNLISHASSKMRIKTEEELHEEALRNFQELLKDKKINASMKFEQVQKQLQTEERWKAIVKISEKKNIFQQYIQDQKKRERQDAKSKGEKARMDFNKMLEESGITSEAKYYKTAHLFVHDQRFRVIEEKQREVYFQDYLDDLFNREREEIKQKKKENREIFREKLLSMKLNSDYSWDDCCLHFKDDKTWLDMFEVDRIIIFSEVIQNIEHQEFEEKRRQKRINERHNRENFRELLKQKIQTGELTHKTKWRNFVHIIKDDPRFMAILHQQGSTPHELFEDQLDTLKEYHKKMKPDIKQYLKNMGWKISVEVTLEEFCTKLQDLTIFNTIDDNIKKYFYFLFVKKARSREKEAQKKAKKVQKKYYKLLKSFKQIKSDSQYIDFEKDIQLEIEEKFEGLKNISLELREKYFIEYTQAILSKNSIGNDEGLVSSDNEDKKKKKHKAKQQQESPYSANDSDNDRKKKKKNYSPDQKDFTRKKIKYNNNDDGGGGGFNYQNDQYSSQQQQQHHQSHSQHQQYHQVPPPSSMSQQYLHHHQQQGQTSNSKIPHSQSHQSNYQQQYQGNNPQASASSQIPYANQKEDQKPLKLPGGIEAPTIIQPQIDILKELQPPKSLQQTYESQDPLIMKQKEEEIINMKKIIQRQQEQLEFFMQQQQNSQQGEKQSTNKNQQQQLKNQQTDQFQTEKTQPIYQQVQLEFPLGGDAGIQPPSSNQESGIPSQQATGIRDDPAKQVEMSATQQRDYIQYQKMMDELEQMNNPINISTARNNADEEEVHGEEGEIKEGTIKEEGEVKEESSGKQDDYSDDQRKTKGKSKHKHNYSDNEDEKDKGSKSKKNSKKQKKKKEKESKKHKSKKKHRNSDSSDSNSD